MLLGERARPLGLVSRGTILPNGSRRLLRALDGSIALNLPRGDDLDLASALVGQEIVGWDDLVLV